MPDLADRLSRSSAVILISDLWLSSSPIELKALGRPNRACIVFHVLPPDEQRPPLSANGAVRLIYSETGEELDLDIDPDALAVYRRGLKDWRRRRQSAVESMSGRYICVSSDNGLERLILRDLRQNMIIGSFAVKIGPEPC